MTGPHPAVAAVRLAVRRGLAALPPGTSGTVLVACSGGPDSVALAAATAFEAPRLGFRAGLVTVDHGLQDGSADRAAAVAELGHRLGLAPIEVRRVDVGSVGGPEAAARTARYAALTAALAAGSASHVLLGHTLDDQAETVLLGLGRGSGARSMAGMRPVDPPWLRPLLGVPRATTRAACVAAGLDTWDDPHNDDPRFTRVRLRREVLPLLEEVLQGGVAEALARTAELLRADSDALDAVASTALAAVTQAGGGSEPRAGGPDAGSELAVSALSGYDPAVRLRVIRTWLVGRGVCGLTSVHLRAVDALLMDWHGQGQVALPGGLVACRRHGRLRVGHPASDPSG